MNFRTTKALRSSLAVAALASSALVSRNAHAGAGVVLSGGQVPAGQPAEIRENDPVGVSAVMAYDIRRGAAAADMRTGTCRVVSAGTLPDQFVTGFIEASCSIGDKVTVTGPGTTVKVKATLHVDGAMSLSGSKGAGEQGVTAKLTVQRNQATITFSHALVPPFQDKPLKETFDIVGATTVENKAAGGSAATGVVESEVEVGVPFELALSMGTHSEGGGFSSFIDFGHTARLDKLEIPAGYTMTSESGVLLTQVGAAGLTVPEDGGVGEHVGSGGTNDGGATGSDGGSFGAGDGSTSGAGSTGDDSGCSTTMRREGGGLAIAGIFAGAIALIARKRRAT